MTSRRVSGTADMLLVVLTWILPAEIALGSELRVLPASSRPDGEVRLLQDHLRPLVHAALDRRLQAYEALKTRIRSGITRNACAPSSSKAWADSRTALRCGPESWAGCKETGFESKS